MIHDVITVLLVLFLPYLRAVDSPVVAVSLPEIMAP